ncbi:Ribonuclease/ribotoxin [Aspergillus caelatus]|uniref:ribonuclease T1 n=1 Tax=Aspergillus caelatus TaxID=61420 RepID=A0A5N7A181_9EURO|nr:Ribonuclease/ribotoxin [Aspergillus caelatus]KAE8363238.1 Ribonuclease/ribotoxin [Aspergillus caelatus]
MPSFFHSVAINALLAVAILSDVASAYPQPAVADVSVPSERSITPIMFYEERDGDIVKRSKTLKIGAKPEKAHTCPKTNRYANPVEYSSGQLQKAFIQAAQYANDGKQIGARKYPHYFGNNEKLPFDCGKKKMEFPLDKDSPGNVYGGQAVTDLPDRIVFEVKEEKKVTRVKFCGVMRHGNDGDFLNCS